MQTISFLTTFSEEKLTILCNLNLKRQLLKPQIINLLILVIYSIVFCFSQSFYGIFVANYILKRWLPPIHKQIKIDESIWYNNLSKSNVAILTIFLFCSAFTVIFLFAIEIKTVFSPRLVSYVHIYFPLIRMHTILIEPYFARRLIDTATKTS